MFTKWLTVLLQVRAMGMVPSPRQKYVDVNSKKAGVDRQGLSPPLGVWDRIGAQCPSLVVGGD